MNNKQRKNRFAKQTELLKAYDALENPTQTERDIYHLLYMRYGIGEYSYYYRHGYIKTLDRAIRTMREMATQRGEVVRI